MHAFGFVARGENMSRPALDGDDRRLAHHHTLVAEEYERVGRSEIDADVARESLADESEQES